MKKQTKRLKVSPQPTNRNDKHIVIVLDDLLNVSIKNFPKDKNSKEQFIVNYIFFNASYQLDELIM